MVERLCNGNSDWHDRGNGPVWAYRLAGKVAGKEKVTTVAALRSPLFCWIYYD